MYFITSIMKTTGILSWGITCLISIFKGSLWLLCEK
jgi:hypothetical protein